MLRRFVLLAIVASFAALFAGNSPTFAGAPTPDRVVDTNVTPCVIGPPSYTSLTNAVAVASPGDEIFVCPGTYTEPTIEINTGILTILGPDAFPGEFSGPATFTVAANTTGTSQFHVTAGSVRIRGLVIDGTLPSGVAGPLYGFDIAGSSVEISDNTFVDQTNPAIWVHSNPTPIGVLIERNQIDTTEAFSAIYCICTFSNIRNNVVNTVAQNRAIGASGDNNSIDHNIVTGGGIDGYGNDVIIDSNSIDAPGLFIGIKAVGDPITVSNNTVKATDLALHIEGNTDLVMPGTDATVIKNTFDSNKAGILIKNVNLPTTATIGGSVADANFFVNSGSGQLLELQNVPDDIPAENNNWGLCSLTEIEAKVLHRADFPSLGTVDFDPFIALGSCPTPTATASARRQGDLDCNGSVNGKDGLPPLLKQAGITTTPPPDCPALGAGTPEFGDVTCDGEEDFHDTIAILQHAADLPIDPPQPGGCTPLGEQLPA